MKVIILAKTPDDGLVVVSDPSGKQCHYQLPQAVIPSGTVTGPDVNSVLDQTIGTKVRVNPSRQTDLNLLHLDSEGGVVIYGINFNSMMLISIKPPAIETVTVAWKDRLIGGKVILPQSDMDILRMLNHPIVL